MTAPAATRACLAALLFAAGGAILGARPAAALELEEYPELTAFINEMAFKHNFAVPELRRLFAGARIRPDIIEAIERPKESLPWHEYKKLFLTEDSARRGRQYWQKNAQVLARARQEYGVPPEVIVAIIGVETQYGRNRGGYPVMDALTTLTLHYPPRADFFRRELEEYLLLTREIGVSPLDVTGSYAGAMGVPQFTPSSYRRFAVDFDGDRRRDLLASTADAIGSVANFLRMHGWETDAPISDEVQIEGALYHWIEGLGPKPALSVRRLIGYGVFPPAGGDDGRLAALIGLEGESGPIYRLGYNNFYVITRYNRSTRYAMAVYELSEMIRKQFEEKP